ncbi:helix-turn-helix transcriptional regulator [Anaerosporobacter sp.]|uniref:helix-turn-helix transcriptional regulator n=1 Tax=Anaerosporobacter sp. TaxID=1872529 RepID=UPI00286F7D91|nr:YafY family protein [Anaerosporobacter sp.]
MNRLFEILYILLQRRNVTAKELAKRFEVSVRTIYRDIDALSLAGVPVYAKKGRYGGICLLDNFIFDKSIVSEEEQREILAALESLREVERGSSEATLSKLSSVFQMGQPKWLAIDFSDWSNQRQELYVSLKQAIIHRKRVQFEYYNRSGEITNRVVEPLQLWFKEYTWYLRAYCVVKEGLRVFKLNRMHDAVVLEESFEQEYSQRILLLEGEEMEEASVANGNEHEQIEEVREVCEIVTLRIAQSQGYRVYDNFDVERIVKQENGDFIVTLSCVLDDWAYGMILSYGKYATVIEPEYVRERIQNILLDTLEAYK